MPLQLGRALFAVFQCRLIQDRMTTTAKLVVLLRTMASRIPRMQMHIEKLYGHHCSSDQEICFQYCTGSPCLKGQFWEDPFTVVKHPCDESATCHTVFCFWNTNDYFAV